MARSLTRPGQCGIAAPLKNRCGGRHVTPGCVPLSLTRGYVRIFPHAAASHFFKTSALSRNAFTSVSRFFILPF